MTFSSGPISRNPVGGSGNLPLFQLPSSRITTWQPGVTYNNIPTGVSGGSIQYAASPGIPTRTTIYQTLSPMSPAAGNVVTIATGTPATITLGSGTWNSIGATAAQKFVFQTTGSLPLTAVNASFTGSISGTTLTTSGVTGTINLVDTVNGAGIPNDVLIVSQLSGTAGGAGTYQLSVNVGTVSSEAMSTGPSLVAMDYYLAPGTNLATGTAQFCPDNGSGASTGVSVNLSGSQSGTQSIGMDDTAQIFAAIQSGASFPGQVLKLNAGLFRMTGGTIQFRTSNITMRGAGTGDGSANTGINGVNTTLPPTYAGVYAVDATATQLVKVDRRDPFGHNFGILSLGQDPSQIGSSFNLTADAVKGTKTCTLASDPGLNVGEQVLIDINTLGTVGVFTATVSGTTLTVSSMTSGTIAAGAYLWDLDSQSGPIKGGPTILPYGTNSTTGVGGTGTYALSTDPATGFTLNALMSTELPNSSAMVWGPDATDGSSGTGPVGRRWFSRQDRGISQVMMVAGLSGASPVTITFETSFNFDYPTALSAQLTRFNTTGAGGAFLNDASLVNCTGIEDMFLWGSNNAGNLNIGLAAYCWIKHVDSAWGTNAMGMAASYRCEVRDSYIHESPDANPGGGGYLTALSRGAADCLFENNIMWFGNKVNVMQSSGGGNVYGYNYMDDAFGSGFPDLSEAGINAAHMAGGHMELLEGNWTHKYQADCYWGNELYITVFRNWITCLRGAHGPLATYSIAGGSRPYGDYGERIGCNMQFTSYKHNLVANVVGMQGQTLLPAEPLGGPIGAQTSFQYEQFTVSQGSEVNMFYFGEQQAGGGTTFVPNQTAGHLRQGNFDWATGRQIFYAAIGDTGSTSTGPLLSFSRSLYINSVPAFFASNSYGANTWPWVDPSTGIPSKLPARERFLAGTPNVL